MLRDKLLSRLREMGDAPDHRRLAIEVLGIRGASEELARRLVTQALVVEDRREAWRRAGERICHTAPSLPAVYVIRDQEGRALYVGKAVNLRRRLRAHFVERRWRAIRPGFAPAAGADWVLVGSEIEALLREAVLIQELQPSVNIQVGSPDLGARHLPRALVRDVLVLVRSIAEDSAELVAARVDGGCLMLRTRRNGADLRADAAQLKRFFRGRAAPDRSMSKLAPIVFSWLAGRGASATRLDPGDAASAGSLRSRLAALLGDEQLFAERLVIYF